MLSVLLASFFVDHTFYHAYGATESIWEWGKLSGPGNIYILAAFKDERDYLIGRRNLYGEGLIRQSFRFMGDTGALFLSGSQKKQGAESFLATEGSGGLGLLLGTKPTAWMRFSSLALLESRGYSLAGSYQDNSGIREELGIEIGHRFISGEMGLKTELRPLNGEQSLRARPVVPLPIGTLSADVYSGRLRYLTVSGEESKGFYELTLSGVFPEAGLIRFSPRFYASQGIYSLNRLNSGGSVGGELGFVARASVAGAQWEWELLRGRGGRDLYEYQGDEQEAWARANFSVRREFSRGRSVYVRSWISKKAYDYPQGFLPDDRDDRALFSVIGLRMSLRPNLLAEMGFTARSQDMVFLKPERSHETRHQEKYSMFGRCAWGGPISLDFRAEVSAVYNTYRFNPQANLLIRFYENALYFKTRRFQSSTRFRLQDQGGYAAGIYYPSAFSREIWLQPLLRVFNIGETGMYVAGRYYIRDEDDGEGWARALEEEGIGVSAKRGSDFEARVLLVKRTGEEPFWDIGLYYNPAQ
ncbi:MAG: hypothetical protein ABIM74_03075 [candidate division WOR-3 bacterium]